MRIAATEIVKDMQRVQTCCKEYTQLHGLLSSCKCSGVFCHTAAVPLQIPVMCGALYTHTTHHSSE